MPPPTSPQATAVVPNAVQYTEVLVKICLQSFKLQIQLFVCLKSHSDSTQDSAIDRGIRENMFTEFQAANM